jgi:transcriptional regulator with XRE-family HTH domain
MVRLTPVPVQRSFKTIGMHIMNARKLQRITNAQLAERAGISVPALRNLVRGDGSASLETFLRVIRVLGIMDKVVHALDPYDTPLGRALIDEVLPKRIRHRREWQ